MRVVAKIINPGVGFFTDHDSFIVRGDEYDNIFRAEAEKADLIFVKTLEDYALVRDIQKPKAFHITTDDPNAHTWRKMDAVFVDPWVRGVLAPTEQVLWNWRVPVMKAFLFPKCSTFVPTHRWEPRIERFVVVLNEAKRRSWHVGGDLLEDLGAKVPITLIGRGNEEVKNVEVLPEVHHGSLSSVISRYAGALMPYRYSASPCWMVEAMLQGMPIVSTDFDYARVHIPESIVHGFDGLVNQIKRIMSNPLAVPTQEHRALYSFNRARAKRQLDFVLNKLV